MGHAWVVLCVVIAWSLAAPVRAQPADAAPPADAAQPLAAAEAHFQAVELDAARDAAHAAVRTGKLDVPELTRAYEIIGVSAAAVNNQEEARAAYLRLLALKLDARSSDILPPEKNRVFYEAQGFWFARTDRFDLTVSQVPERRVEVNVRDPLAMAHTLSYGPANRPEQREKRSLRQLSFPLWLTFPKDSARELAFELRDAYGNVLVRRTLTLTEPVVPPPNAVTVSEPEPGGPGPLTTPPSRSDKRSVWRSPWLWGAVSVVVVGAAVTTTLLVIRDREVPVRTDVSVGN
jgi:hypothetical protein